MAGGRGRGATWAVVSYNVPFSNLIGNWSCGFATPPLTDFSTLLMCSHAYSVLTEQLIQQLFDLFFALMLEMSLQLQTSGVKSLSNTDSLIGGSRTSSAALSLTLLWQKETAFSVYSSPQHSGWSEITILSSVELSAHLCEASITVFHLLCHCALSGMNGWRDNGQTIIFTHQTAASFIFWLPFRNKVLCISPDVDIWVQQAGGFTQLAYYWLCQLQTFCSVVLFVVCESLWAQFKLACLVECLKVLCLAFFYFLFI